MEYENRQENGVSPRRERSRSSPRPPPPGDRDQYARSRSPSSPSRRKHSSKRSRPSRSRSPPPPPARRERRSRSRSPQRHFGGGGNRENPSPNKCLGVFGLSLRTTERDLRDVFGRYGRIDECTVVIDAQSGRSRGFAFLYFEQVDDAKDAKDNCNGIEIDGRRIRVDFSITQRAHTPTPGVYMGKAPRRRDDYPPRRRDDYPRRRSPSPRYSRRRRSRSRSYSPAARRYAY